MGRDYFSICKPIAEGLTITTRAAKKSKNKNGSVKANGVQVETYWIAPLPGAVRPRRACRRAPRMAAVSLREIAGHQTGLPPFRNAPARDL